MHPKCAHRCSASSPRMMAERLQQKSIDDGVKKRDSKRDSKREREGFLCLVSLSLFSLKREKVGEKKSNKKKTHLRTVSSEQHASCWYSRQTFTSDGMYVGVDTCCVLFVAETKRVSYIYRKRKLRRRCGPKKAATLSPKNHHSRLTFTIKKRTTHTHTLW